MGTWRLDIFVYLYFVQAAWEEVQQSQVELAQTRRRVQGLKQQLVVRKKETAAADELHCDAAAL